jgi:transposase-like protein
MSKAPNTKTRIPRTPEFKKQAIALAVEIGVPEAAEKLGIKSLQTLASWVRHDKKKNTDSAIMSSMKLKKRLSGSRKIWRRKRKLLPS